MFPDGGAGFSILPRLGVNVSILVVVAVLVVAGCGEKDTGAEKVITSMPDPCGLAEGSFVSSVLGSQPGSPEKDDSPEQRVCWWWSGASKQTARATLGVGVSKKGFGGSGDADARIAEARDFYRKWTLEGKGACQNFESKAYTACWSYRSPVTLNVVVRRANAVINVSASASRYAQMSDAQRFESAKQIAQHMASRL